MDLIDLTHVDRPAENESIYSKPFWNVYELSQVTGLAVQTIYNKVSSGEIPHRKKGRKVYFFPDEIINWIDEGE